MRNVGLGMSSSSDSTKPREPWAYLGTYMKSCGPLKKAKHSSASSWNLVFLFSQARRILPGQAATIGFRGFSSRSDIYLLLGLAERLRQPFDHVPQPMQFVRLVRVVPRAAFGIECRAAVGVRVVPDAVPDHRVVRRGGKDHQGKGLGADAGDDGRERRRRVALTAVPPDDHLAQTDGWRGVLRHGNSSKGTKG